MDPKTKLSAADCQDSNNKEACQALAKLPYCRLISTLTFLGIATRGNICFAVSLLSQFLNNFGQAHWDAAVQVLWYVNGTHKYRLMLGCGKNGAILTTLLGMCNSSYANDLNTQCSVSGYLFSLRAGAISWQSCRQLVVTQSTCKAKYIATCNAAKEAVWLCQLLHKIGYNQDQLMLILGDNQGAIALVKSQSHHKKAKHIDVRYHFICKQHKAGSIKMDYVRMHNNIANIFTKPLTRLMFAPLCRRLGICPLGSHPNTIHNPTNPVLNSCH